MLDTVILWRLTDVLVSMCWDWRTTLKETWKQSAETFKEQMQRSSEGWYETRLMWDVGHPQLDNYKVASLRRLSNLLKKLKRNPELYEEYDNKIKERLAVGIVEHAANFPDKSEFYIPHKPVLKEAAEITKLRIVYDASSRPNSQSPSLNECLETSPLQNLIGDLKQALLQIRIRQPERDVLRFHWIEDRETHLPFIFGGIIEYHLDQYKEKYLELVEEILRNLYVDDIIGAESQSMRLKRLRLSLYVELLPHQTKCN